MLSKLIEDRTVTSLGISIGTGLALETLFRDKKLGDKPKLEIYDPKRKLPKAVNPDDYQTHIYNIYTLFRNVIGSIKYNVKDELAGDSRVHDQLLNDMYLLIELYNNTTADIAFYLPDYASIYARFDRGKKGSVYAPYSVHSFIESNIKRLAFPGTVIKGKPTGLLPRTAGKILLLSHYTIDLLSVKNIPDLSLLESHTGKIKTKVEFGTKYHPIGKRDLTHLPINPKLLYMLGDKTIVRPYDIKDRRAIYEISIVKHWTPTMSEQVISRHIMKYDTKIPV